MKKYLHFVLVVENDIFIYLYRYIYGGSNLPKSKTYEDINKHIATTLNAIKKQIN